MNQFESKGYTGKMFEGEVLARLPDTWRSEGYFDEPRSYQWVRENQIWNPSDPNSKIANELHFLVAQKLGLDNVNDLKLYSSLNSPLDYYYGIDAFFEIGDTRLTLDLSINPHKEATAKADMILHEKDLLTEDGLSKASATISLYLSRYLDGSNIQKLAA